MKAWRALSTLNLPMLPGEGVLSDTDPDPGYFGPGSVTWQVMSEPLLVLGGIRGVLMQIAHPLVAEGVIRHSDFERDPFSRLINTYNWTIAVCFGTKREAQAACRGINRQHARVTGSLDAARATRRRAAGEEYSARQHDLVRWVHATLVDTLLVTYESLVGPLPPGQADRFVTEWNQVARLMGVPRRDCFESRAEMAAYIADQLCGDAEVGRGSRRVARSLLHGPTPVWRPVWPALRLISMGLTDPGLRRRFGVRWGPAQEQAFRSLTAAQRVVRRATPPGLRRSALSDFAARRCRGELVQRGVA